MTIGFRDLLVSLTQEELKKLPVISERQIRIALEKGRRDREAVEAAR